MRATKSIGHISFSEVKLFPEKDLFFKNNFHKVIKNRNGLYVFVDATGRLYKDTSTSSTPIWQRIDSTVHFGYNIAAFPFSYRDKIYNLGGYGIWRINGQLREYNESENTWDIVKVNKEIPLMFDEKSHLLWYDYSKGAIYLGYSIQRNEAVKSIEIDEKKLDYTVRKLDLNNKDWTDLGELSIPLKDKIPSLLTLTMSPWGQLVTIGDKINLIDYERNKLLVLNFTKNGYQTILRKKSDNYLFFKDSTLFIGSLNSSAFDSISFSYKDFTPTEIPIYEQLKTESLISSKKVAIIIICLMTAASLWLLSSRYKIQLIKKDEKYTEKGAMLTQPRDKKLFDEQEVNLLLAIINNTEIGRLTSIEEINNVLGLTRRSPEIQKKHRSDVILGINQKFSFLVPLQNNLIEKQRSLEDRRSFDYFIAKGNIDTIKSILTSKDKKAL